METSPFMLIPASLKLSPSSHCSLLSLGSRLSPRLLPRPRTPFLSSSSIPLGLRNNCKARELANYFPNIVPTVHYAPSKPAGKRRQSTDSWKRVVRYVFKGKVILLCFSESLWLGRGVNFQVWNSKFVPIRIEAIYQSVIWFQVHKNIYIAILQSRFDAPPLADTIIFINVS